MKRFTLIAAMTTAAFTWAASGPMLSSAEARPKARKGQAAAAIAAEAPAIKMAPELSPKGLRFGMSPSEVAELYDKALDREYVPLYRKVQPGPRMNALDAELREKKLSFRRSRVDFGTLPTGIDQTPIAGEYGYRTNESLMSIKQGEGTRYFFFHEEKLWKVYDELRLAEGSDLGATYQEGLEALAKRFEAVGRVREADPASGRNATEADWVDPQTRIRAIDRGYEDVLALVYEQRTKAEALVELRKANQKDANAMDPAVLAIVRGGGSESPEPPPEKGSDKKKSGKKKK